MALAKRIGLSHDTAMRARHLLLSLACWIACLLPLQGQAQSPPVDLQLILAVDASGSVDNDEWTLQLKGYVQALRDPEVHRAIRSGGEHQAIAVTFIQWSGYSYQAQVLDWTRISSAGEANQFADRLAATSREIFGGGTSLSGIIDFGVREFGRCPFPAPRRVLDISGDGMNRNSRPAAEARDEAVARGITINGLPILGSEDDLDRWYQANVVGGSGAFMIVAQDFVSFATAIRNKLIREIASRD